jgi:acyl-CoA thioester hydrolase
MENPASTDASGFGAPFFSCSIRVSYAHCTLGNHVYYARYLDFLEVARGEFFRQIGFTCQTLQDQDTIFQVTECGLKYLKPARYDDLIEVRISVGEIRKVRMKLNYQIVRGSDIIVHAWTGMVCADTHEKPKRIPEQLIKAFEPYQAKIAA